MQTFGVPIINTSPAIHMGSLPSNGGNQSDEVRVRIPNCRYDYFPKGVRVSA
ncbi:MAG: hypothetical protein JW891_17320 [Candidatus Lokiarchaeota archaeon]|nr:hypothetical protein [Candidatus Lokiarchaeota archaeon]